MRLNEITKAAFHQKLANPVLNEVLDELVPFANELYDIGWDVDVTESANGDYVSVECTNHDYNVTADWIKTWKIYDYSFMPDLTEEDIEIEMVREDDDKLIFNINILRRG